MYIEINDNDYEKVEEVLNNANISFTSNNDPTYYFISERVKKIIENNIFVNNSSDVQDLIEFIYDDFNPLLLDEELIEKILIFNS